MISNINNIIENFNRVNILAIGDLMIDQYLEGSVTRISPEAPVPVVDVEYEQYKLGGAANAINNIKSLGGSVEAIGIIGKDDSGKMLLDMLMEKGIDTKGIIISDDRPTILKTRVIGNGHQIVRIDKEIRNPIDNKTTECVLNYIKQRINDFNAILISDYNKGFISQQLLSGIVSLAQLYNIPIIVNSKAEKLCSYKNISIIITDLSYASEAVGIKAINETSVRNVGQWLLTHLDCRGVLIIRGKKGITLFDKNNDVKNHFINPIEANDITGVSDVLTGVMALSLASGLDLQNAATIVNAAANVAFKKKGVHTITKDELLEQIS